MKVAQLIFILCSFLFLSCEERDDYSKISKDYNYDAIFAFPMGTTKLNLEESAINLPPGWQQTPMIFDTLKNINFSGVTPFDLRSMSRDLTYFYSLTLNVLTTNKFPTSASMSIFLANKSKQIIDTLAGSIVIDASKADGDSAMNSFSIVLNQQRLNNLILTKYFSYKCIMNNEEVNSEFFVKYPDYYIKIETGALIHLKFNPKDIKE